MRTGSKSFTDISSGTCFIDAFGDLCDGGDDIDDSAVTNNGDRDKVLATVASTILDFTERHGRIAVFAEGSTPARTRLYQMAINNHFAEIEVLFLIHGKHMGCLRPFEPGINYESFLVIKK